MFNWRPSDLACAMAYVKLILESQLSSESFLAHAIFFPAITEVYFHVSVGECSLCHRLCYAQAMY